MLRRAPNLIIKANAKLNLYLRVVGRRENGYHDLDMLMQSIDLHDTLTFEKSDGLTIEQDALPLCRLAAESFFRLSKIDGGLDIKIEKRIPFESGLGGASADCAATLFAANKLYGSPLTEDSLLKIAAELGADVPFSLRGGCQRARGIGEIFSSATNMLDCYYLILKPRAGICTADAFELYDRLEAEQAPSIEQCANAINLGDIHTFSKSVHNSLERAAVLLCPEIADMLSFLGEHALASFMTGSGSACVGVFENSKDAQNVLNLAHNIAEFSYIAQSSKTGLEEICF